MFTGREADAGLIVAAAIVLLVAGAFLLLIGNRFKEDKLVCLRWSWGGLVGILMGVAFLINKISLALMASFLLLALALGVFFKKY